jgi:hypothetical protein
MHLLGLRVLLGGMALRFPTLSASTLLGCANARGYTGSLFGVRANVVIDLHTRVAQVQLRGVAVGGSVGGEGWFSSPTAEQGAVVLDNDFAAALRRRHISIVRAALDRSKDIITVVTTVPLFGEQTITLYPVEHDEQDDSADTFRAPVEPIPGSFIPLCGEDSELPVLY